MSSSKVTAASEAIAGLLRSAAAPMSGRAIKAGLAKAHPRAAVEAALRVGLDSGLLLAVDGSRNARLYRVGSLDVPSVPSVPPAVSQVSRAGPDGVCTRRELADRLGVNMQTVTKWERDGLPIAERGRKGKPSFYSERDVRGWLEAREEAAQTSGVFDVARERARKDRAQAVLAEQTYEMRARDLLSRLDVEKAWAAEVSAVRTKLLSWSTTIADRVHRAGTLDGVVGVERELRDAAENVLRELADPSRVVDDADDASESDEPAA